MELNKVHHLDWLENGLPDKSVQLIIADPPYFEIKGEFDFIWSSFEEYLQDVEKWAAECARLLADNGSLFWWGDDKRIAYSQIVLDKQFCLLNSMVWYKYNLRGGMFGSSGSDVPRSFSIVSERLLFYDKGSENDEWKKSALQYLHDRPDLFMDLKKYFDQELEAAGLTVKDACAKFGSSCSHFFGFSLRPKTQFMIPTKEKWELLQTTGRFQRPYKIIKTMEEGMLVEYEGIRDEFESKRRVFKNSHNLTEILQFNTQSGGNFAHPTMKPEDLTRAIIQTTTNKGDLILVPFAGSGTECAMAAREGREFIGFDIEAKYVDMANKRAKRELSTPTLF